MIRHLSITATAKACGISWTRIRDAMDAYERSGGTRGLKHACDGEDAEGKRKRWTTERWIEEWQESQVIQTKPKRYKAAPTLNGQPVNYDKIFEMYQ